MSKSIVRLLPVLMFVSVIALVGCGGGSASRHGSPTSATGPTPIGPGDPGTGVPHGGRTSEPGGRGGVNTPDAGGTGLPPTRATSR